MLSVIVYLQGNNVSYHEVHKSIMVKITSTSDGPPSFALLFILCLNELLFELSYHLIG